METGPAMEVLPWGGEGVPVILRAGAASEIADAAPAGLGVGCEVAPETLEGEGHELA